jgi:hypothetical protein
MSYNINKTNGLKLTTVEDGSINLTACDLTLVGKNYAGYGQALNENLVKLLENFANNSQPSRPLTGQIWYDTIAKTIKFYNGTEFKSLSSLKSAIGDPGNLSAGDMWFDETDEKLYYFNGTDYILIGPQFSGITAANGIFPAVVEDIDGLNHYILKYQIQSYADEATVITVSVLSTEEFTLSSRTPIAGFSIIKHGMTLRDTNSDGVSAESSVIDPMIWGSSSDSLRLSGRLASEFVLYTNPVFATTVQVNTNQGINIGSNGLVLKIDLNSAAQINSDKTVIELNPTFSGIQYNVANFDVSDGIRILPTKTAGQTTDIGKSTNKFNNMYANTFVGNLTGTATVATTAIQTQATLTKGSYLTGSNFNGSSATTWDVDATSANSASKVVARDASGNFSAGTITANLTGVASSAAQTQSTLTRGSYLTGSNFNGSAATTWAVDATTTNTGNKVVARDASGNFSAGTITASLSGSVSGNVTGTLTGNVTGATSINLVTSGRISWPDNQYSGAGDTCYIDTYNDGAENQRLRLYVDNDSGDKIELNAAGGVVVPRGTIDSIATSAQYADLAEMYLPDAKYDPGTVLMIGGEKEVTICNTYESERVVGIVSTDPAYLMNSKLEGGVAIALKGRVPCKVKGPVQRGDILVSSNISGHAESRRYGNRTNPFAVIGKALQDFSGDTGVIEVMVH